MKANVVIFMLLLFNVFTNLNAQDSLTSYSSEGPFNITINDERITLHLGQSSVEGEEILPIDIVDYPYWKKTISKTSFIKIQDLEYLILKSKEVLFLFGNRKCSEYFLTSKSGRYTEAFQIPKEICTSSVGTDESVVYEANNMEFPKLDRPWASKGNTGHEWIELAFNEKISILFIINGFISFNKPSLYIENGRLKTIKITDDENHVFYREIEDDPNPQSVFLISPSKSIKIDIIETYEGLKYRNICMSWISGLANPDLFK